MRLSRAIVLAFALLIAGGAAANGRVDMQVRLVLVDQCTIDADARTRAEAIEVECSSGEPYRLDALSGNEPGATVAARIPTSKQDPQRPGLTIFF